MIVTTTFEKLNNLRHKNKIIQGSKGAGKTRAILLRWILWASIGKIRNHASIVTDTMPNLRKGAIKDFEDICNEENIKVQKTKNPFIFKIGLWTFEFFSIDKESKGLGGRRDRLFINECNRIPWATARQLISRTHTEFICDFNPERKFWAHEQFVDVGDCDFMKVTYVDNEALPVAEVESLEKHAPWGLVPDENYWRVYGLGEIGFIQGMILKGYEKFKDLPEGQYQESIGVDWGWEDPMTAVKVWVDHEKKHLYWREIFYASNAPESELFLAIKNFEFYKQDIVACDHSPRAILAARDFGLSALAANKKNGIVTDIRTIKQYKLFIHEDSTNLINEADFWKWQVKGDQIIEYPDQSCSDHALDAAKYGTTIIIRR